MRSSRSPIVLLGVALAALSCGGESTPAAPTPTPTPVVVATPTPVPAPTPTPTPSPTPCPGCDGFGLNTNPPARLNLRLYSIEDPSGQHHPAGNVCTNGCPSTGAEIRIGWTARLDVIAKDVNNRETVGSEPVEFFVSNPDIVWIRSQNQTHQRRLQAVGVGTTQVWAIQQGVRSGTLGLSFIP